MFVGSVTNPGSSPEEMLFCRATTAGATLLSGMPVPSPVSHAKQQADAKIAELQAKLAALEAMVSALQPVVPPARSPLANAIAAWPGRGGVDQWSGMPLSVGRWVK